MGQYFKIINLDKFEQLEMNDGYKMLEFCYVKTSVLTHLAHLLRPKGRWYNDKILFVGDYCDEADNEQQVRQYTISQMQKNNPELYAKYEQKLNQTNANNEKNNTEHEYSLYHIADDLFKTIKSKMQYKDIYLQRYFYNHNDKQYFDILECPYSEGTNIFYADGSYADFVIHPIAILTTLSGSGSSDYDPQDANDVSFIGSWVGASITCSKTLNYPSYTKIIPNFRNTKEIVLSTSTMEQIMYKMMLDAMPTL